VVWQAGEIDEGARQEEGSGNMGQEQAGEGLPTIARDMRALGSVGMTAGAGTIARPVVGVFG